MTKFLARLYAVIVLLLAIHLLPAAAASPKTGAPVLSVLTGSEYLRAELNGKLYDVPVAALQAYLTPAPAAPYAVPTFEDDFTTLSLFQTPSPGWPPASPTGNWAPFLQVGWPANTPPQDMAARWDTNPNNHEAQAYDPSALSLLPGGGVAITATPTPLYGQPWTSGALTLNRSLAMTGGYWEVTAQLPGILGTWPAVWIMPAQGGWAYEIDGLEAAGVDASGNPSPNTIHLGANNDNDSSSTGSFVALPDVSAEPHKIGILWQLPPGNVELYYDDALVGSTPTPANATTPGYLLINQAIFAGGDGSWAPAPASSVTSSVMKVLKVRLYAPGSWGSSHIPVTPAVAKKAS